MFGSFSSLRGKLTVVILATTAIALLTMTVALLHRDLTEYRRSLAFDLTTDADIIALLTAPAMEFNDPRVAEQKSCRAQRQACRDECRAVFGGRLAVCAATPARAPRPRRRACR